MRRAERVVAAFRSPREAGQAARLTQGADAVAAAGEDFVGIGLVADIPDHPVARGVEHIMQGHRKLDHAKAGAKMAARDGHRVDGLPPEFVGDLPQVRFGQRPQVGGRRDAVKHGGF